MKKIIYIILTILFSILFLIPNTLAHVPYLEHTDFTIDTPFIVRKSITQSIAMYAWLQKDEFNHSNDIDIYCFTIKNKPLLVHLEVIVPVCDGYYSNFTPWFALVGPNLPPPNQTLPFNIPQGYGVIIKEDVNPGQPREQFYEPFGGKWYYQGPKFDQIINISGTYYVYYWDHYQTGGDYVAVLGYKEIFYPIDIVRALINTWLIRHNQELHISPD